MIYFTSDLHFYHENIISHSNRPFSNSEEMNQILIENWNEKIKANDEIYILGDVTMLGAAYATEALEQLKGRKYLIKGNHDLFVNKQAFDRSIFEWVKDYHELNYQKEQFVLFHYPIASWNHIHRGSIHLHGHQHNSKEYNQENLEKGLRRYDVGVDANNMAPVSIEEILAFFRK